MGSDCDKARVEGSRSQSLFCVSPHVATNSAPRRSHAPHCMARNGVLRKPSN